MLREGDIFWNKIQLFLSGRLFFDLLVCCTKLCVCFLGLLQVWFSLM